MVATLVTSTPVAVDCESDLSDSELKHWRHDCEDHTLLSRLCSFFYQKMKSHRNFRKAALSSPQTSGLLWLSAHRGLIWAGQLAKCFEDNAQATDFCSRAFLRAPGTHVPQGLHGNHWSVGGGCLQRFSEKPSRLFGDRVRCLWSCWTRSHWQISAETSNFVFGLKASHSFFLFCAHYSRDSSESLTVFCLLCCCLPCFLINSTSPEEVSKNGRCGLWFCALIKKFRGF